ncbi:hypothetical protein [Bacillus aquiflavi]|uniref:hypothetical protein n=1 Tax=Bacillus aquiflavi TaxID=2672567 RepID=UPI00223BC1FE|nr:hypothetical protein [Bacillus aquiflavi]
MKNDFDEFNDRSRSEQRAKRRKTNIILNSLIIAVLILIIIVAVSIFSSGDKEQVKTDDKKTVEKSEKNE